MDCPAVMMLDDFPSVMTLVNKGLSSIRRMIFPMPESAKAIQQTVCVDVSNGSDIPTRVDKSPISDIVFLLFLSIQIEVGIEMSKNHINTIDGRKPARASLQLK